MPYRVLLGIILGVFISVASFAQKNWEEVAPGVWKTVIGNPDEYNLLTASEVPPKLEGLTKMPAVVFPLDPSEIVAEVTENQTQLRFPLQREEQLFGFGLNFKTVHQRGRILRLHVDHYGDSDNGRTHAPVPFYVSSAGYGVFVNSAR